jgi:hypothetical protein
MADLKSMTKKASLEVIRQGLKSSDAWLLRGLVVIYGFQTEAEQAMGVTAEDNGLGFNGVDSEFLSSLAEQYMKRGTLSPRQIEFARKKMVKYARQLLLVARGEVQASA